MNLFSLVFSPTGGTKKAAEALCAGFPLPVHTIDLCDAAFDFASLRFTTQDLCIFSVPSFGGRVPGPAAKRMAAVQGGGALAVLLTAYGNRAFDDTLVEMKDLAQAAGFRCVAAVAAVAEHSIARCYAAGRPDDADVQELTGYGNRIYETIQGNTLPAELRVPGNHPYRTFGGVGMIPLPDARCNGCGTCAALCPTGAISPQDPAQVDAALCISCMRCVAVCPAHGRHAEAEKVAATEQKLANLCADRKHNALFLLFFQKSKKTRRFCLTFYRLYGLCCPQKGR